MEAALERAKMTRAAIQADIREYDVTELSAEQMFGKVMSLHVEKSYDNFEEIKSDLADFAREQVELLYSCLNSRLDCDESDMKIDDSTIIDLGTGYGEDQDNFSSTVRYD